MKEKLQQLKEQKSMGKWFRRDNLIVIILSGILLLVIAMPVGKKEEAKETEIKKHAEIREVQNTDERSGMQSVSTNYEVMLEQRLKQILEGMSGAGKVEVMITLSSSEEVVVEKDRPVARENTTEEDGEGGKRVIGKTDTGETTVYQGEGTEREPYVVKTLTPRVEGVLIAAQGAGTGEVTKNITEAVQALFDLDAHKVKVIRMKSSP